ncbi:hypothetical protein FNU77_07850 [Prescottella equi]|uniref:Integral membrane protein n=1 Tax=Rhodococcus hoagii TaxID=43767 RepID=A0AAE4ZG62_RHOHA|nr:hypothetical protein [Prescottella equi]NKS26612.1 hypothetical protein [Prescottella equi]ORL98404.1 hypothetical protein A5N69_09960 [Prescottella equi]ORM17029.1 hypothetical protein A5N74_15130 [Prescottella equi]QDP09638.1 hypothetical protein FNU77_07850 [Prescottella equi]BCN78317.1 hypothetical protein RE0346_19770 [Prescottella equi]
MNLSKASKAAAASVLAVAALGTGAGTAYAGTAPGDVSVPLVQPVVDKQTAQDNLLREIGIGWERGGPAAMATGAGVGLAIGCVSIFPNFIAGCILGTGIGAGIGAYNGITGANPNVQPAFYEWLNATP